jgi:GDPmannose 4,6-dehydratase
MPSALITGISGQDGSYLAEFLLGKGYRVAGTTRDRGRATRGHLTRIAHAIELHETGLEDADGLRRLVQRCAPDEVYNLAGQTHVGASWDDPVGTAEADAIAVTRLLEALRGSSPAPRFFQASTCEMFAPSSAALREESPFEPSSPYGVAKLYGHCSVGAYRRRYEMHAVSGILFNHESPRRDESFVTRKITRAVSRIARGAQRQLRLGNLEPRRDWGFAGDYVEVMWRMLQQDVPEDFVVGTGEAHSVREFCDAAFAEVGLDYREFVAVDDALVRAADTAVRVADASRARAALGWTPKVSFAELVKMMVHADLTTP